MNRIISTILSLQSGISNLNTVKYGDPYVILNTGSIDYSACVIEALDTVVARGVTSYNLRLTIVDKLNEDESNLLDVYDACAMQLHDIVLGLGESGYDCALSYTINYVKQDFTDKLAGVYADITVNDLTFMCKYEPDEE